MKKILICLTLLFSPFVVKADPISFDLGKGVIFDVPFTQVDGVALWDFKSKTGLAGAETSLLSYKKFQLTGGAVTSTAGHGTPFLRSYVLLPNPVGNFASLEAVKPGIFIGRNFNDNVWIYGVAASLPLW